MAKIVLLFQYILCFVIFGLIVLGAGVRIADAGLACPDWPLCHGELVPSFNFQIFMEWIHRAIAMGAGILALLISVLVWADARLRRLVGLWTLVCLILFGIQAWLGRQTVIELLRAEMVASHLMGGYSLLALNLFILGRLKRDLNGEILKIDGISLKLRFFAFLMVILSFVQAILGGTVSSHYAGMACPDFPTCNGSWWPDFVGPVGIQYLHRLGAYTVFIASLVFCLLARFHPVLKRFAFLGMGLVFLQILWGVWMIFSLVHPGLSLLHSLTSISIFTTYFWSARRVASR